jgi:hypothetical protein
MRNCTWYGCSEIPPINPKTNRQFTHCEKHRTLVRPQKMASYYHHKEQRRGWTMAKWRRLRSEFFKLYGNKCMCCDITGEVFLALDHVKGDGKEHRAKRSKFGVYEDAVKQYDPERFQVLCHNCNFAKYQLGKCPHNLARMEITK